MSECVSVRICLDMFVVCIYVWFSPFREILLGCVWVYVSEMCVCVCVKCVGVCV